jgi:hypothetical protein
MFHNPWTIEGPVASTAIGCPWEVVQPIDIPEPSSPVSLP